MGSYNYVKTEKLTPRVDILKQKVWLEKFFKEYKGGHAYFVKKKLSDYTDVRVHILQDKIYVPLFRYGLFRGFFTVNGRGEKRDTESSEIGYFILDKENEFQPKGQTVVLFEGLADAISYKRLKEQGHFNLRAKTVSYVFCDGLFGVQTAFEDFIDDNRVILAIDNDEEATNVVQKIEFRRGRQELHRPPPQFKDWSEFYLSL